MQVLNHYNFNVLFYDGKEINFTQEKSLDRIMAFFSDGNQVHNENSRFARSIYRVLGWENYLSFDVINSFWTIYTCGLAIANDLLVDEKELGKRYHEFSKDKKTVLLNKGYIKKSTMQITILREIKYAFF